MAFLLDSHTFLWMVQDSPRLSPAAREVVSKDSDILYFSVVSAWELTIKVALGRLDLKIPVQELFTTIQDRLTVRTLGVEVKHLDQLLRLPASTHKDPFDRMIASQSLAENLPVISADSALDAYGVSRIW